MSRLAAVSIALLVLASATHASGQSLPDLVNCPFTNGCEIRLQGDQAKVQVVARVNPLFVPKLPALAREVLLSASRCCLDSLSVRQDPSGYFPVGWSGSGPITEPVRILMGVQQGDQLRQDTLLLLPAERTSPEVVGARPSDEPYVWYRGEYIPSPTRVRISMLNGQLVANQAACERVMVFFNPRMEGKATPDSTKALWDDRAETEDRCMAETRWKLGNTTGAQEMDITVGGRNGIAPVRMQQTAFARQGPRLVVGYGIFDRIVRDRTVTCTTAADHDICTRFDSTALPRDTTVTDRSRGNAPYFGLEGPIFFWHRANDPIRQYIYKHVRAVFGTTFDYPEQNPFLGVTIAPLLDSATESVPFQLTAGITIPQKKFYYGLEMDATAVVVPVLSVLGISGR